MMTRRPSLCLSVCLLVQYIGMVFFFFLRGEGPIWGSEYEYRYMYMDIDASKLSFHSFFFARD